MCCYSISTLLVALFCFHIKLNSSHCNSLICLVICRKILPGNRISNQPGGYPNRKRKKRQDEMVNSETKKKNFGKKAPFFGTFRRYVTMAGLRWRWHTKPVLMGIIVLSIINNCMWTFSMQNVYMQLVPLYIACPYYQFLHRLTRSLEALHQTASFYQCSPLW